MIHLCLYLPYMVSGKNSITVTRTGLRYPTKRFQVWRDIAVQLLREQSRGNLNIPFTTPLSCRMTVRVTDKRKRDIPGMVDAIFHCLERAGIVKDDGLITRMTFSSSTVKGIKEVCIEISLEECE